jgi:hypothetical protein
MSTRPKIVAALIKELDREELRELRQLLEDDWDDESGAGVAAKLPPQLPLKGSAIAEDLPEDYWETAQ